MQRQELEKPVWSTRGLGHLENRLQSCRDEARRQACYRSIFVFASRLFQEMWQRELQGLTEGRAQALLKGVMNLCFMPRDLSGTCEETAFLLKRFWPDWQPHSPFLRSFSWVVQVAFAREPLASQEGNQFLKRQFHQLRYLLSATCHSGFGSTLGVGRQVMKKLYKTSLANVRESFSRMGSIVFFRYPSALTASIAAS